MTNAPLGEDDLCEVTIPMMWGRIPIRAGRDDSGGPKTEAIRIHVSMSLRLQRWLGFQKTLYVINDIPPR